MMSYRVRIKTGRDTWTLLVGKFQTFEGAERWATEISEEGYGLVTGYAIQRDIDGHWINAISVEHGAVAS